MTKRESSKEVTKKIKTVETLAPGEIMVVAKVKLLLNRGRLHVTPGQVVILGPLDREQGVHIENLLKNQGVVPYESEEQAEAIRKEWEEVIRPEREKMRFGQRRGGR